jgi:hypothetical protein
LFKPSHSISSSTDTNNNKHFGPSKLLHNKSLAL